MYFLKSLSSYIRWIYPAVGCLLFFSCFAGRTDDATWLKEETQKQLAGCRVISDSGVVLHTPDGIGHYKALWTRDYYYMLKYAGEFMDTAETKASIEYLLAGQREDGCIPDRVNAEGRAIYSPGPPNKPMADHALDNGPFMALIACEYTRTSGDLEFFRKIEPALKRALDQINRAGNGLVYNSPENPQCVYGFTDIVTKTGHLLFSSLLYYKACLEMELMCEKSGFGDGLEYANRADLIRKNINRLWNAEAGMFFAADIDCRQIDVWGSAFAVEVGIASSSEASRIAEYLLRNKGNLFRCGQVRHLPDGELWQRMFSRSYPPGSYQNGAYWATPLPWIVPVIKLKSPEFARQLVNDAIKDFRENGVAECINEENRKVPNFVVSITNLYGANALLY